MCLGVGAPGGVKTITNEQGAAYGTAIDQAKAEFGDASTVFNDLMTSMSPIVKAGPLQMGETAQQASAINAATIDQTAAQYKNAATAVRSSEAARGGGNVALPSGVNIATEEALAEAGAQQESTGLRENLQANYELGNKNWQFATSTLEKAPGVFADANQATGEATTAGKEALAGQQIRASYPTWGKIAMGAIGDVAGMASSMIPGGTALEKGIGSGLDAVQNVASNQANG
jgi:hypothetical protein